MVPGEAEDGDFIERERIYEADDEGLAAVRVGDPPEFAAGHGHRLYAAGQTVALPEGHFPDHVLGLPVVDERVGKRIELGYVDVCCLVLNAGPAAAVGRP